MNIRDTGYLKIRGEGGAISQKIVVNLKKNQIPIKITWYYSLTAKMLSKVGSSHPEFLQLSV